MKNILAIVMALALVLTSFVFVSAETDATVTVDTVEGPLSAGEEIALSVTITDWSNAYATILVNIPEYDVNLLTFDGFEASETDFSGALIASGKGGFGLVASPTTDATAREFRGGEICVMHFTVVAEITASTNVSVVVDANSYTKGAADGWNEFREITIESVSGGVYVENTDHTCISTGTIRYNGTYHWYDCENEDCGNLIDKALHTGGEATCIVKAECSVCGCKYGAFDDGNHKNTEVRDVTLSYTGDTWCLDCDTIVEKGSVIENDNPVDVIATVATVDGPFSAGDEIAIPVTVTNWANAYATIDVSMPTYDGSLLEFDGFDSSATDFGGSMASSGSNGFALIASPSSKKQADKLLGGEVCVMYFYAVVDIEESTTVSVKVKANGYIYGEEDEWVENTSLAVESVSGGIRVAQECSHTGGEATCIAKATCSVCGEEYGEVDSDNHKNTEVRNVSSVYSGDTWCIDCNQMIEEGTVLKVLGDADTDGDVTIIDAMIIAQYSTRIDVTIDLDVSDVDGDGSITIIDAMMVAQYSANLIDKFPIEQE